MGLYDLDFHAWAEQQADAIRRRSANEIDWENLLDEVQDLSRRQRDRLRNHFVVLIAHLLKWQFQPDFRRGWSWIYSVREQRLQIERHLSENPSLKSVLHDEFARAYSGALLWAVRETEDRIEQDYPDHAPFTLQEALDPAWPPSMVAWAEENERRPR